MRPLRLERHAQRLAGPEQLRLADHLVDRARPQPFRERHDVGVGRGRRTTTRPGRRRCGAAEQVAGHVGGQGRSIVVAPARSFGADRRHGTGVSSKPTDSAATFGSCFTTCSSNHRE